MENFLPLHVVRVWEKWSAPAAYSRTKVFHYARSFSLLQQNFISTLTLNWRTFEVVWVCKSAAKLMSIPVSPRLGFSMKLFQARTAPCGAVRGSAAALGMRGPSPPPHCTSSFQPSMPHASAISRNLPQAFIFHRPSGSRKPLAPCFALCSQRGRPVE